MSWNDPQYGITSRHSGRGFDEVVAATREALAGEGFGVLTEIDVQATLKKKLDVDMPRYLILGACNPPLAHKAITAEPGIGLLLPCNVVVAEDGGDVVVSAVDPVVQFKVIERPDVEPIACDVKERLERVIGELRTKLG